MTDTENGLRADVFARPADDAPRRAYADWLTARGDGYGNFITAQLTGQTARAAALFPSIAERAACGLAQRPRLERFRRGFLVEVNMSVLTPEVSRAVETVDAWGAVERLDFAAGRPQHARPRDCATITALARTGRLGALTHLTAHGAVVSALAAVFDRPLTQLEVMGLDAPPSFGALVGPATDVTLHLFHAIRIKEGPGRVRLDVDDEGAADEAVLSAVLGGLIKPDDEVMLGIDDRAARLGALVRATVLRVPHARLVAPPAMLRH